MDDRGKAEYSSWEYAFAPLLGAADTFLVFYIANTVTGGACCWKPARTRLGKALVLFPHTHTHEYRLTLEFQERAGGCHELKEEYRLTSEFPPGVGIPGICRWRGHEPRERLSCNNGSLGAYRRASNQRAHHRVAEGKGGNSWRGEGGSSLR